ncbi:uncharacterized protein LAJ45_06332 [Morchella importuna]|uniref:uncharacterized protein n=1 Tax=Morchella importuna TaxID=1174673 RepID=UPI001E8DDB8E|nr:uncharacterized protein LAJ45_06332 [Morchella importuna]KAH8149701.1 hypothetical protein LAJ45_06332 [Morchella importuna]
MADLPPLSIKSLAVGLLILYFVRKLILFVYRSYTNYRFATANKCLPAARFPSPWIGIPNWWSIVKAARTSEHVALICNRYKQYGNTITGYMLGATHIATCEPENIKTILATNFKDWGLGSARYNSFYPLLGPGIFTSDGPAWEHSRALLRPQFSRDQVSDIESLDIHVNRLMGWIDKSAGKIVDLQPLFFRFTLDSATEFLLGESVNTLLEEDDGKRANGQMNFGQAFDTAQKYLMVRMRARGLYWLVNPKEFKAANKICHDLVDRFVYAALGKKNSMKSEPQPEKKKYVFLDSLVEQNEDVEYLRYQLLHILLAGRDTTASLLGACFVLLSRHPQVYAKLRTEILNSIGDGKDGRIPSFAEIKDITYLRYVLNETLRLYPSVPLNGRTSVRNTILPKGGGPDGQSPVFVPKGQRCDYSVRAMHLREDLYGPDAAKFRPERWAEGAGKGWDYLPFNGGPRICLGQQYALTEASYTVLRILQKYESIEPADDLPYEKVPLVSSLTTAPALATVRLQKAA